MPVGADPGVWRPVFLVALLLLSIGAFTIWRPRRGRWGLAFKGACVGAFLLALATPFLFFGSFAPVDDLSYQYLYTLPGDFALFVTATNALAICCVAIIVIFSLKRDVRAGAAAMGASLMLVLLVTFNLIGVHLP